MSHDPEVIKFVIDFVDGAITTLSVVFISFLIIMYLIDKRKKYKEFKIGKRWTKYRSHDG